MLDRDEALERVLGDRRLLAEVSALLVADVPLKLATIRAGR